MKRAGILDMTKKAEFVRYGNRVEKFFKRIKHPEKYVFVVTGHQGEPKAVLPRMVRQNFFKFHEEDHMIFSCSVIPVKNNIINRDKLDAALKKEKVRLFTDVHVSGHAFREDLRDMIRLLKPKNIIPTHASKKKLQSMKELAMDMGFKPNQVKILKNGVRVSF